MKALMILLLSLSVSSYTMAQSATERLNSEVGALLRAGKWEEALKKALATLATDSLDADASRIVQDIKKPPSSYYAQRVAQYPSVALYHYLYARAIRNDGKPDSMRYHLEQSIALDSSFFWGYIGLASISVNSKEMAAQAYPLLDRAEALRPNSRMVRNWRGILLLAMEKPREALPVIYQIIRDEPTAEMFSYLDKAHKMILSPGATIMQQDSTVVYALADSAMALWTISRQPAVALKTALAVDRTYASVRSDLEKRIGKAETENISRLEQNFREKVEARIASLPKGVSAEASSILTMTQKMVQSFQTFYDESIISSRSSGTGSVREQVQIYVTAAAKPQKYRFERRDKDEMLLSYYLRSDSTTWQVMPSRKQYIVKNATTVVGTAGNEQNPASASMGPDGEMECANIVRSEIVPIGGRSLQCDVVVVHYRPSQIQGRTQSDRVKTYWIDRESRMPVKDSLHMLSLMPFGIEETFTTTTSRKRLVNTALPDTLFVFNAPSDWKAVDNFLSKPGALAKGKAAPLFSLSDLEGAAYRIEGYRGHVVLMDFWATWCAPCREELPRIQKLYEELRGKGLVVLGINNEKKELPAAYVKENKYTFPTLMDIGGRTMREFSVNVIPTVVIIDKEGVVSTVFVGVRSEQELRSALTAAGL